MITTHHPDLTLAAVRELSEHATLRPAPRVLRCVPFITQPELKPVMAWQYQRNQLLEIVNRKS